MIKRNDEACGGDCFDYVEKYYNLTWWEVSSIDPMNGKGRDFDSRPCTLDDVG